MKFASRYVMDEAAENEGRWVEFGEGAKLKIARATNPEAEKMRKRLMKPFERPGFRTRKVSEEDDKRITAQVLAYACVRDWEGVTLEGLPPSFLEKLEKEQIQVDAYSPKLCEALMLEYEDFYRDVLLCATNEELYRKEALEESAQD